MNNLKVSIIMPTFMHEKFIHRAIESVLAQEYKNWELIIVNDGSSDNTEQMVCKYQKECRIKYYSKKNEGVSKARNYAIDKATGEYISYLDSDDIYLPNHLKQKINQLERSNSDFVYGPIYIDKKDNNSIFYPNFSKSKEGCIMPLMVLHKKKCFDLSKFNPNILFEEDLELFLKFKKEFKVTQVNEPTAIYNIHNLSIHKIYEREGEEGVLKFRLMNAK